MTLKEEQHIARCYAGKKAKAQGDYFEALIEARILEVVGSLLTTPRLRRQISKVSCMEAKP